MVLRRPPHGSLVKSAHDMGREFRVLSVLHSLYDPAPRPFAYCDDPGILGAPFYLMERKRGTIIRRELPQWLAGNPVALRTMSAAVIDNLADLHALDVDSAGLSAFGKPQGYVQRQVDGWKKRWIDAQTEPTPDGGHRGVVGPPRPCEAGR
jgi:aminoglycoside phosphotransferase (APT) family kinase protein